jgi:hypothetical protein
MQYRLSLGFLAEAQPRLENIRGQKALFSTLNFLSERTNYKAKNIIGKITNQFILSLSFSNRYIY